MKKCIDVVCMDGHSRQWDASPEAPGARSSTASQVMTYSRNLGSMGFFIHVAEVSPEFVKLCHP